MNGVPMAVAWLAAKPPSAADSPVRLDIAGSFLSVHYILPAPLAKAACPGTLKAVQLSDADLYWPRRYSMLVLLFISR